MEGPCSQRGFPEEVSWHLKDEHQGARHVRSRESSMSSGPDGREE